jgi:gluconate transporter
LAKKSGKSLIYYGIPLTAGLAVTHAFIPPTPGPVAVASILGADIGLVILFGFIVGVPCACLAGPIYATFLAKRLYVPVPAHILEASHNKPAHLPSFASVAALLIFPLVAILIGTLAKFTIPDGFLKEALLFIGHPFIALTIATIACFKVLGKKQGLSSEQIRNIASRGLEPVALVILVTGAGGMFKQVLIDSGAGQAFADVVALSPLPPLAAGFLIAISVRIIQGSATVAMLTAAGLMSPVVQDLAFSPAVLALMTIAIAAGATAMSHVNDTGFWIINRYFDISVKDTFVSWTCMATLIGFIGLFLVLMLGLFV